MNQQEKLWSMIKKHHFAMMTTREEGGTLRRPMATIERDFDVTIPANTNAANSAV